MTTTTILQATNSLIRYHIGITYFQACRLKRTMEVNHQFMFSTFACNTFVEVHHPLVAMIHEVYLKSANTHISIILNEVHVILDSEPSQPKDNAYTTLATILNQLFHINLITSDKRIAHIFIPTFV